MVAQMGRQGRSQPFPRWSRIRKYALASEKFYRCKKRELGLKMSYTILYLVFHQLSSCQAQLRLAFVAGFQCLLCFCVLLWDFFLQFSDITCGNGGKCSHYKRDGLPLGHTWYEALWCRQGEEKNKWRELNIIPMIHIKLNLRMLKWQRCSFRKVVYFTCIWGHSDFFPSFPKSLSTNTVGAFSILESSALTTRRFSNSPTLFYWV